MKWALQTFVCAGLILGSARSTTLPPELKAYDFSEAYYIEDGGVVISPYPRGFFSPHGIVTPEGIRVMPGDTFVQYDSGREICEEYRFVRLNETQAFFHERLFRYHIGHDGKGRSIYVRDNYLSSDDFYLTQFRGMEWADHLFPGIDLHPGLQEWRSKNYLSAGR